MPPPLRAWAKMAYLRCQYSPAASSAAPTAMPRATCPRRADPVVVDGQLEEEGDANDEGEDANAGEPVAPHDLLPLPLSHRRQEVVGGRRRRLGGGRRRRRRGADGLRGRWLRGPGAGRERTRHGLEGSDAVLQARYGLAVPLLDRADLFPQGAQLLLHGRAGPGLVWVRGRLSGEERPAVGAEEAVRLIGVMAIWALYGRLQRGRVHGGRGHTPMIAESDALGRCARAGKSRYPYRQPLGRPRDGAQPN